MWRTVYSSNIYVRGGTSKKHSIVKKKKIKDDREDFKKLVDLITEVSILYLKEQIISGVDIIKVFESWAGLLDEKDYEEFVIEPNKKIRNL